MPKSMRQQRQAVFYSPKMIPVYDEKTDSVIIHDCLKICPKCEVVKDGSRFPLRKQNRDGLYSYCSECAAKDAESYYHANKELCSQRAKKKYEATKHVPAYKERLASYRKRRRANDPMFRASQNLRGRVTSALRRAGVTKTSKFHDLLGCTPRQAVFVLTNGGHEIPPGVHVDHHIPCAFFDLRIPDHQRVCFNWRNLRILTADENRRKHDALPSDYREILTEICSALGVTPDFHVR